MLGERLDGVGDDRGLPLAQGREQVTVRDDGDALLPRAVAGSEVLVDVEALGQQRAYRLDEERVQLVGRFQRRPGQPVGLRHVLAAQDLVRPLLGDVQGRAASRRARASWAGRSSRRGSAAASSRAPPCSAIAGISVAAVAPEPITTTRLPARSRSSGHRWGCTTTPWKRSMPSHWGR